MSHRLTDSRLANLGAHAIYQAFDEFQVEFNAITRRAKARFEEQDWHGMQADAAERLDLYKKVVERVLAELFALLKARSHDKLIWASMKAVYSGLIAGRDDWMLAETFFNSATRRIFTTVGVDPQIEFVDTDFDQPPTQARQAFHRSYEYAGSTASMIEDILTGYYFKVAYGDLAQMTRQVAVTLEAHFFAQDVGLDGACVEMIKAVFYRGQGAYLVGRVLSGLHLIPFVLALRHAHTGIVVDAMLLHEEEVSVLFSFTRSYFHVEVDRPYDFVRFLKSLMPRKRLAELYNAIGYNKQGKTELYRDLLHHLANGADQFEIAAGTPGMIMIVFALPAFDSVFKIIRDDFPPPKDTTREAVQEKYRLVFKHDRAGRLVDAQEFEYLRFERWRFSETLLEELLHEAKQTVSVEESHVILKHVYVERQVTPLNLYLPEAGAEEAAAAVVDYGHALKDLAKTNIFPGDLLLKNFGVTRHRRVVFYDYDELCLLTDCNFRALPQPRTYEEEISAEPWFSVREHDVFPEEFERFLGLYGRLRELFLAHHADLFAPDFWQHLQNRFHDGEVIDILPYDETKRIRY